MEVESKLFLGRKFKEYYSRHTVRAPEEVEKREFGVGTLSDKIKTRHKSFRSERDLNGFLSLEAPFYISYSTAFYEFPTNPMTDKNWQGAEIVFDLDKKMDLLDSALLSEVKDQALRLLDFILGDFGMAKNHVTVNFSGSKGYHIHILDPAVRRLGGDERRELVDYVTGNLDFRDYLRIEGDSRESVIYGPKSGEGGWRGRIYSELHRVLSAKTQKELEEVPGIGEKTAEKIFKSRDKILEEIDAGRYDNIPDIVTVERASQKTADPNEKVYRIKSVRSPLLERIIRGYSVDLGAEDTDKMVTIDTSRLIRLPDTIHGGSGLVAKQVADLEKFDPLTDALAFGCEETKMLLKEDVAAFDLGGVRHGPLAAGEQTLPEYAAIYLLLKDKADTVR